MIAKYMTINENWTKSETLLFLKNKALNEAEKNKAKENDLKKQGFKKVWVDHPTQPRCKIEKWVKI